MMMGNGNELDQHNGMYITVQPNQIYQHSNYHDDYQPHDYQQPIIGGGHGSMSEEPTHSAPKQRQVKVACVGCKKACKKCDNARPCGRCSRYGLTANECYDAPRKIKEKKPFSKENTRTSKSLKQDLRNDHINHIFGSNQSNLNNLMNMNQNLGTSTCNSSTNMSQMSQMHRSSSTLTNLTDNTNNGSLIHSSLPSLVQTSYHDQSNNLLDHNTPLYSAYYPYSYSMQNNNSQIDNLGIQNNKNYNHHINYQNTNNLYMNQMEVPHPSYFEEVTPNQINNKQSTNNTQTNMNMNLHTSFYGQTDPQIDTCHPYYYSNYNLNHTGIGYVNQITNTNQTYSNSPSIGISAKERKEKMKPSVNDFLLESDGLE